MVKKDAREGVQQALKGGGGGRFESSFCRRIARWHTCLSSPSGDIACNQSQGDTYFVFLTASMN